MATYKRSTEDYVHDSLDGVKQACEIQEARGLSWPAALILLVASLWPAGADAGQTDVLLTAYFCEYVPGYYTGDGGGYCGATTSGLLPFPGAAACGDAFPLWTWLWLPELERWAVCVDRGGGLGPYSVDLWFATNRAMQESGVLGVGRTIAWAVGP